MGENENEENENEESPLRDGDLDDITGNPDHELIDIDPEHYNHYGEMDRAEGSGVIHYVNQMSLDNMSDRGHHVTGTWKGPSIGHIAEYTMVSPKSKNRRCGDEEYMPLSYQWQHGVDQDNVEVVSTSSSDEESNLASSVDYEQQQCLRKKGRTHTRDRLGAWRLSNPEVIQQHIRGPGSVESRRSSGGSQRRGRKSLSRKSKSLSGRTNVSRNMLKNQVPQQWPVPALGK